MRYIYFSPHLDDAVLSAGGLIYEQTKSGTPVEIWSFMCGFPPNGDLSPLAQRLHQQWGTSGPDETIHIRRAEDQKAAAIVGAKAVHYDFLDCIYRRAHDGQWLYSNVFVEPNPAEADLPAQIAQTMIAWLQPDDVAICQLSVGSHVDHVIVRTAAEMLKRQMVYDVDIPYLFNHPNQLNPKTTGMKEGSVQKVSEAGFQSWLEAAEAYESQLSSLFDSRDVMRQKLRGYWSQSGGIRFWEFE